MKLAVENIKNWIFVSGAVRSGTTFTGRVLSLPLEVDYLHEPYNQLRSRLENPGARPYVRLSLETQEMQFYHDFTERIFRYDIELPTYIPQNDVWFKKLAKKTFGSRGPFYLRLAKANIFHKSAIIKDPIALFLTEYLYTYFQVKPVILIKHPISFVVSMKRKNWWRTPRNFSSQNNLAKDYFSDEPDYFQKDWSTPIEALAAYWRVLYKVLLNQCSKYRDWNLIIHEEMCQDPLSFFKHLYPKLDLPWSNSIEKKIIVMTNGKSLNSKMPGKIHSLRRNSSEIFNTSIKSLTVEERRAIFNIVEDIALPIYTVDSFYLNRV